MSLAVQISTELDVQHSSVTFGCPLNTLSRGLKKHEQEELNNLTSPGKGENEEPVAVCF